MIKASGIMFVTKEAEVLFLLRGDGGDYPLHWCFPGGRLEDGESTLDAAKREAIEEIGKLPKGEQHKWTQTITPGDDLTDSVDFTTFVQKVDDKFEPTVNGEHVGFAWAPISNPPQPTHPGVFIALQRFDLDELGIAKAMALGALVSPQVYENISLFALRITGTGTAYRRKLEEHVYRPPEEYLTDEFLQRCNGLPVIWEHPDQSVLSSKEYADRIVGAIMLPYIQGDEVWGIAKIHDAKAAEFMASEQLSTSPSVYFRDPSVNSKVELEDGSTLLLEGKPSLLDHLAICAVGVWDKGGAPSGVRSETREDSDMAENETEEQRKAREAIEAKARADADSSSKLDAVLAAISGISDSVAGVSRRMDALEEAEKAKKDAEEEKERNDAQGRRDAEREEWMKSDAAECARDDEEEDKDKEKYEKEGDAKEVAADKARKDRKARMDARRKDEDEKEKDEKEKADSEKAKADAARSLQEQIAAAIASHLPRQTSDADRLIMADAQARADAVYTAFGSKAPPPLVGEAPLDYRVRLLKVQQKHSKPWKEIDLRALPATALGIAEGQIYADAMSAARNPDDIGEGQLRSIVNTDETGRRITTFVGDPNAWMSQFRTRPRQLVKPFFKANRQQGS